MGKLSPIHTSNQLHKTAVVVSESKTTTRTGAMVTAYRCPACNRNLSFLTVVGHIATKGVLTPDNGVLGLSKSDPVWSVHTCPICNYFISEPAKTRVRVYESEVL